MIIVIIAITIIVIRIIEVKVIRIMNNNNIVIIEIRIEILQGASLGMGSLHIKVIVSVMNNTLTEEFTTFSMTMGGY